MNSKSTKQGSLNADITYFVTFNFWVYKAKLFNP